MRFQRTTYNAPMFFLLVVLVSLTLSSQADAVPFSIRNGDTDVHVDTITDSGTASEYYNYHDWDGYPAFGPEANTGFFWLYEDSNTGNISLGMIFNQAQEPQVTGSHGEAMLQVAGLPNGAFIEFLDDDGDQAHAVGDSADLDFWWFPYHTDGAVIGGLTDFAVDDIVTISVLYSLGIESWYFLTGTGDPANPDRIALDMSQDLVIHDPPAGGNDTVPTPTPEPATMLLLGSGLLGLGAFGRKAGRQKA